MNISPRSVRQTIFGVFCFNLLCGLTPLLGFTNSQHHAAFISMALAIGAVLALFTVAAILDARGLLPRNRAQNSLFLAATLIMPLCYTTPAITGLLQGSVQWWGPMSAFFLLGAFSGAISPEKFGLAQHVPAESPQVST